MGSGLDFEPFSNARLDRRKNGCFPEGIHACHLEHGGDIALDF